MGNLQGKELETPARPVALGEGIKGDLHSDGRSRPRPGGCGEGPSNMGRNHGPGDNSGGPGESILGGGPGTSSVVALAHGLMVRHRLWPDTEGRMKKKAPIVPLVACIGTRIFRECTVTDKG